jgi:hypothetical protein
MTGFERTTKFIIPPPSDCGTCDDECPYFIHGDLYDYCEMNWEIQERGSNWWIIKPNPLKCLGSGEYEEIIIIKKIKENKNE